MKIGLSSQIYWDYQTLDLEKTTRHVALDMGFDAVEIHCEDPLFKGWGREEGEKTKEKVKETLSTIDVEPTIHGPSHDLNLASLNHGVRKETLSQLEEALEFANYIDSEVVVVHPGTVSSRKYRKGECLEVTIKQLKKLCEKAEDLGVKVCMENMANRERELAISIPQIKEIIREVDHPSFGITLDLAHANTTESGPSKFVTELREHVEHVHASDNTGEDVHFPVGEGDIDFKSALEKLQPFGGAVILEGWMPRNEDPFVKLEKNRIDEIVEDL